MAVDKLVDSTQLNSDLTSVANAIRTKGGTSAQLAFPSGFVNAINDISGGGGSDHETFVGNKKTLSWAKVTVGQNSVTNVPQVYKYFSSALGFDASTDAVRIIFTDDPNNTLVNNYIASKDNPSMNNTDRYKNGSWGIAQNDAGYDAALPVGAVYYVAGWITNV